VAVAAVVVVVVVVVPFEMNYEDCFCQNKTLLVLYYVSFLLIDTHLYV